MKNDSCKVCKTCQHYESLHRNAGFCTNNEILVEGINIGVLVRAEKSACSLYSNLADAKAAVIFADSGASVEESFAIRQTSQQLAFDIAV